MPHKDPSEHRPHSHRHHMHIHRSKVRKRKKKIPALVPRQSEQGRRFIQSLRNKYRGEEIWILGTGPSMDDYPDDFFDDKISIGLKNNIEVFPSCTFHLSTIGPHKSKALRQPEFLRKHIFGLRTQKPRFRIWVPEKYSQLPVYMWQYRINVNHPGHWELPSEAIDRIMHEKPLRHPIEDTISQLAIQAAVILGAKKITLVGCEERSVNGNFFAQRYRKYYGGRKFGCSEEMVKKLWKAGSRQRKANRLFAKALKYFGVELILFHLKDSDQYKAGYSKII